MTKPRDLDRETQILEFLEAGHSYLEAQEKFNTSPSQIARIKKRWIAEGSTTTTTLPHTTTTIKSEKKELNEQKENFSENDSKGSTTTTTLPHTTTTNIFTPDSMLILLLGNVKRHLRKGKRPTQEDDFEKLEKYLIQMNLI